MWRNCYEMKKIIYEELKESLSDTTAKIYEINKNICGIKTNKAEKTARMVYNCFYESTDYFFRYEYVVFDCSKAYKSQPVYSDFLSACKKRDFDEKKDTLLLRQSLEKAFRFLLNEYIVNFKSRKLAERKNIYFDITSQGKFVAIKKNCGESIFCNLSASEKTLFNLLCFIEINKFRQFVNGVKNFNYEEKPLILMSFPDCLDESFNYISFLEEQKLNREIIIVSDIMCTENVALNPV